MVTNPFTARTSGEICLVHLCLGCGKISVNRIAGDDVPEKIIELLHTPKEESQKGCVELLYSSDIEIVATALWGFNYKQFIGFTK